MAKDSKDSTDQSALDNAEKVKQEKSLKRASSWEQRLLTPSGSFWFAVTLWTYQLLFIIGMKEFGYMERELRPMRKLVEFTEHAQQTLSNVTHDMLEKVIPHLNTSLSSMTDSLAYLTEEKTRPGYLLAQEGAKAKYPIVIIPGFSTTQLELWAGEECGRKYFRQRLWGGMSFAKILVNERECWRRHMTLDPFTGLDPEGIKLRAVEGLPSSDYFLPTFWIWGKIIQNLADVGYTSVDMSVAPYDWRLSFHNLEKRDGYLSLLKAKIETLHKMNGDKVVIASHSMGGLLVHHFFAWVTTSEEAGGGGGGEKWVDQHVHAFLNLAGSYLGAPKTIGALLAGDVSDIATCDSYVEKIVERVLGRRQRRDLWNSWGGVWSIAPKGGDALWGPAPDMCPTRSDDDPFCPVDRLSPVVVMSDSTENMTEANWEQAAKRSSALNEFMKKQNHSVSEAMRFLPIHGGGLGPEIAYAKELSYEGEEKSSSRIWHDPTRTPLPYAPNMKIYCMYGRGISTDRGFFFKRNYDEISDETKDWTDLPLVMDPWVNDEELNVKNGIRYVDGDGSVPLISLGYMCADAWRRKETGLNPSGTTTYTREFTHRKEFDLDDPFRSGPYTGEHVDFLGNVDVTEEVVRVVTGFGVDKVNKDKIESDIFEISRKINEHPQGGIKAKS